MKRPAMNFASRHARPRVRRWGSDLMILGGVLFFVPLFLPGADPFADAHELWTMASRHLWWQFAGVAVFVLGNTLRLIGVQGHPGMPWPLIGRRPPPDLVASLELRRRAAENRASALSEASDPTSERARPRRRRFRFVAGRAIRVYGRRVCRSASRRQLEASRRGD
jgi:hypothetical protein